jgi:antirestriction protein
MTQNQTPRIYVACLAAYNNGKLHGRWIDCDQDANDIWVEINEMLSNSPEPDAEEWAIHDFENWQEIKIDEHESIERIAELAQLLSEHGKAFALYCEYYGNDSTLEDFQEHYLGQYKDEEDFVYQMWEQDGRLKKLEELGIPESYIDWEAIARDWFIDSYFSVEVSYEETYVFSRH